MPQPLKRTHFSWRSYHGHQVLIHRKIKPGREKDLSEAVKELRSKAIHAQGYISGETLRSIEDPSVHLVISTWKSIEDWVDNPERKALEQKIDAILEEPSKITPTSTSSYLSIWLRHLPALSLA